MLEYQNTNKTIPNIDKSLRPGVNSLPFPWTRHNVRAIHPKVSSGSRWHIVSYTNHLDEKYNLRMFAVRDTAILLIVFINIWFSLSKKFEKFSEVFLRVQNLQVSVYYPDHFQVSILFLYYPYLSYYLFKKKNNINLQTSLSNKYLNVQLI